MIKFIFKIHLFFLFKIIYFLILFLFLLKNYFLKILIFVRFQNFFYLYNLYNSLYYDFKKRYFKMSVFSRFQKKLFFCPDNSTFYF